MRAVDRLGLSLFGLTAMLLGGDASPAQAQPQGGPYGPGMMGDFGWGPMVFGGLMMILFWGGLIVADRPRCPLPGRIAPRRRRHGAGAAADAA